MKHPLRRTRRSFTLLELMVAFIIMAILSAVAIPSLIGVVGNDQVTADNTSAVAIADAAYYNGQAAGGYTVTALDASAYIPNGTPVTIEDGTDSGGHAILIFIFGDPIDVCVLAPVGAGASSPSIDPLACSGYSVTDGPYAGPGVTTTTSTSTTTSTTTTTTVPPVVTDGSSAPGEPDCTLSATGPYSAYSSPSAWSITCTGVTGSEVYSRVKVGSGEIFTLRIDSADFNLNGPGPGSFAALPSSFTLSTGYINPTDDSTPSAPWITYNNFGPWSSFGGPQSFTGQMDTTGTDDACMDHYAGCSTPTSSLSGF